MSYTGLCIDGPRKGEFVKSKTDWFRNMPELTYADFSAALHAKPYETRSPITYQHVQGYRNYNDRSYELDFWTCERKELKDILNELVRVFSNSCERER